MSRIKVLLISSAVVFVIFVLLAFFSGSSILLSLFKALVSACLVVMFLLLANFFLIKYIPDFFDDKSKMDVADTAMQGANLDIRIDDNTFSDLENTSEVSSIKKDFSNPTPLGVMKDGQEDENSHSDSSSDFKRMSFAVEDEKLDGDNKNMSSLPVDNMQKTASEVNVAVNVDDAQLSQEELSQTIEKDVDRLEELPDLQEFVDTSNLSVEQTRGDELMNTGTQSFFATDLSEDVTDTNLMAKAVRTVLKREI